MGEDGTEEYLKSESVEYTFTNYNSGICEGMNRLLKKLNLIIFYMHMMILFLSRLGSGHAEGN